MRNHVIKLMTQFTVNDRNVEATLEQGRRWWDLCFRFYFPCHAIANVVTKCYTCHSCCAHNVCVCVFFFSSFCRPCVWRACLHYHVWHSRVNRGFMCCYRRVRHFFFSRSRLPSSRQDKISNLDNILMASVSTRAIYKKIEKINVLVCSFVRCQSM